MTVKEAVNKRYSTRNYVPNKEVAQKIIDDIIDAGRYAPNGLGIEPWKFYILKGDLEKLRDVTFNQQHIVDASFVVVFVHYTDNYFKNNKSDIYSRWNSIGFDKDKQDFYYNYLDGVAGQYFKEQLMFSGAQMALQAAGHNVGSVIVGGFDPKGVAKLINLDESKYKVGLMASFGISADKETKQRIRRPKEETYEEVIL